MDTAALRDVYGNLRAEILKRIEIEHQIISLSLIALGATLTVGLTQTNATFLLLYPILIMFLAAAWCDNHIRLGEISAYIKEEIAPKIGIDVIGWELAQNKFYSFPYGLRHSILTIIGKRGVFFGSQIIVIALALTKLTHPDKTQYIYIGIAVAATFITIIMLATSRPIRKMPS